MSDDKMKTVVLVLILVLSVMMLVAIARIKKHVPQEYTKQDTIVIPCKDTLTPEQKLFRSKCIGGSDVKVIMSGEPEAVLKLWRIKRGEEQDEDLDDVLAVQMGTFTEPLNERWFTKNTGRIVTNQQQQLLSKEYPFMGCTLDGLTDDGKTVFEMKHV